MLSTLLSLITVAVCGRLIALLRFKYQRYMDDLAQAKNTGLVCIPTPFIANGYLSMGISDMILPYVRALPSTSSWRWINVLDRHESWSRPRESSVSYGETYLLVGLNGTFLRTSNAELIGQIVARKFDFPKPVEGYRIMDIFGKSILTAEEGNEWRRHRKVVGPSFSEKSNKLVFKESLQQATRMMDMWNFGAIIPSPV